MKGTMRRIEPYLYMVPYALSLTGFILFPFFLAMALAFMRFDLTRPEEIQFVGLANFREALTDQYFWRALRATLSYVVLMVPGTLVLGFLLALGLSSMRRGKHFVRALLFLPGMLNVAVAGILWQWFYNGEFGLFNYLLRSWGLPAVPWLASKWLAMPSIVVMSLWWTLGGTTIVLLAGLDQIPQEIHEAAALDGAGAWQTFWRVTLPMMKPVLLFVAVMNTIGSFQVFGQPFMLTRGGPELTTRGVVQYIYETAFQSYRLGYGAAMSWLLFAAIAGFAFIQYRLIRRERT